MASRYRGMAQFHGRLRSASSSVPHDYHALRGANIGQLVSDDRSTKFHHFTPRSRSH